MSTAHALSRKQKLEKLFASLHAIKRGMVSPRALGTSSQITGSQWMVLRLIENQKECTAKEIAKNFAMSSSAATQLINALVRGGHVVRTASPHDKRFVHLCLSRKTKKELTRMKKRALMKLLDTFKVLNDKEFDQYFRLNEKIVDTLKNKNPFRY